MQIIRIFLAIMIVSSASTLSDEEENNRKKKNNTPTISEIEIDYLSNNGRRPFSPITSVLFKLGRDCKVKVEFFSITGQSVDVAENSYLKAGNHRIFLDTSNICSGIYWLLISTPDTSVVKKMTLLK